MSSPAPIIRIPEHVIPGKRLGRHILHDPRSRAFPFRRSAPAMVTTLHARHIPILNQGNVGACTGNAEAGALGTDPLFGALPAAHPVLDEGLAQSLYSAAETIDGDGPFPPNDFGSSGLSVCKAAQQAGYISGYTHCFTRDDALAALVEGPVLFGVSWYDSFDSPDPSTGEVKIAPGAQVRGGHEIVGRGIEVTTQMILLDNSWGTGWGLQGSFTMSWATLGQLLDQQGDATVPVPLSQPAPQPVS